MLVGRLLSRVCSKALVTSKLQEPFLITSTLHSGVVTPNPAGMGDRQSPVDLTGAVPSTSLTPLNISFKNGPDRANLRAINNGGTLHVDCVGQILGKLSGGPVEGGDYTLQQFHFHWGDCAEHGSEHTIEGKSSSAELHFVFKNEKYGTVGEAIEKGDGLAVAGVMIKESTSAGNSVMPELFDVVPKLRTKEDSSPLAKTLDLGSALPSNRSYFTYLGSLTTPGFNECVTWIVFKEEVEVSSKHMAQLRIMKNTEGAEILNNWRELQNIAGREIKLVS